MIRSGPAPSATAARTKSRSRTDSAAPRTRRATVVQPTSDDDHEDAVQAGADPTAPARPGTPSLPRSTAASTISSGSSGSAITAVGQPHQQSVVRPPAVDPATRPIDGAEHGGGERADQPDEQRHLPAIEQAQQHVAAELVGAERMLRRWAARSGRAGRPRWDRGRASRRPAAPPGCTARAAAARCRWPRQAVAQEPAHSRRRGERPAVPAARRRREQSERLSVIGDPRVEPGIDHVAPRLLASVSSVANSSPTRATLKSLPMIES